jgi:hypothetical protein
MQQKLSYKKFTLITLMLILCYLLYHVTVWTFYSSKIFDREDGNYIGDLGRMSYQVDSLFPRKLSYDLPKRILNTKPYTNQKVDVLTIGDSFSNGVMGGKNPYYQDFLASKYNLNILNIMNITNNQHKLFETIISLYNNGWLVKHKPKLVIIESAERGVYERFAKDFDFSQKNISIDKLIVPAKEKDSFIPNLALINTANYKTPFYTLKYHFKNRAQKDVVKLALNKELFSTKNYKNSLLFHYSDIEYIRNDKNLVKKINQNFNKLAQMLNTLDIKLMFLVAPDKYDIYYDYIKNNPYPKNDFFTLMKPLKKEYLFLDTKKILTDELKKNVKDLYYSDDTHWSYKASDTISSDKLFKEIFSKENRQ